ACQTAKNGCRPTPRGAFPGNRPAIRCRASGETTSASWLQLLDPLDRLGASFQTAVSRSPQDAARVRSRRGAIYLMLRSAPRGGSRSTHDDTFSIGYRHG